jgi:two-component system sensor histidine kinase KdpD
MDSACAAQQAWRMNSPAPLLQTTQSWANAPTLPHMFRAGAFLSAATLATHFLPGTLPEASGLLLYFIAVLIASVRYGFWIGIGSAFAAFAVFNFLFVQPRYTFAIAKPEDLLILAGFLGVAGLTGFLAGRLREEANVATSRATVLEVLSTFAAELATATDPDAIESALIHHASALAMGSALTLHPKTDQLAPHTALDAADLQAAERAFHRQMAQDSTQPGQQGGRFAFLPLVQSGEVVMVLGYHRLATDHADCRVREQAIEAICHQANLALERLRLAKTSEDARTSATRESLRAALLTSLSHDLRTPLATILGAITSLRQLAETLPPAARDDLALAIEQEARRLSHYVDNLLHMTRLQAGVELHLAWVDPADVIRAAVDRVIRAFPYARISVDLPELPMLQLEAGLLEQALFNLLDNAVKFSTKGVIVTVSADAGPAGVSVTITDKGPGIPTAALSEIFKPFYRGDLRGAGTGLGMTISHGIVRALGGTITAKSPVQDGRGTALIITLPLPEPDR